MASTNASKVLMQVLTTPSKLAARLDWRKVNQGSILSLNIHSDRIGLALASHPSYHNAAAGDDHSSSAYTLESIPLARKSKLTEESKIALANIVEQHKVCGFVVSWPLQPDSQRMGAACGRVLHTLEQLVVATTTTTEQQQQQEGDGKQHKKQSAPLISANRPCVLWNDTASKQMEDASSPDIFGRLKAYSKVPSSDKTVHIASIEQYNISDEATVASQVWDDFMSVHWPDLHREKQELKRQQQQEQLVVAAASLQQQTQTQTTSTLLTQSAAIAAVAQAAKQGRSSSDDGYYMQAAV